MRAWIARFSFSSKTLHRQPGGFEAFCAVAVAAYAVTMVSPASSRSGLSSDRSALEPLFHLPLVHGKLVSRLPAYNQRHKELADPVTLEVELDRHAGSRTVLKRLDGAPADRSDRTVDATEGESAWWVVLRQLGGHRPLTATDPACLGHLRTLAERAITLQARS